MSQQTLPGFREALVAASIETLRTYVPRNGSPYYGCFSGGKDSVVIKELAREAAVPVEWHYNVTTIDPPELVQFIKREHPDVALEKPTKGGFFQRMLVSGIPTRRARWCCEEFKEARSPKGARLILGIRAAESKRRAANWATFTYHKRTREYAVLPILHWRDDDVWAFIRERGLPYCSLYDEGFKRLGCIGCPMAREAGRRKQFARWPNVAKQWKRTFRKLWEKRSGTTQRDGRDWFGDRHFETWEQMWDWWISDEPLPGESDECDGQLHLW